jgi:hypothetical protein
MRMTRTTWWKVFGLAGVVGVVATGAVIARAERRRRAYTPQEVRDRLLDRHAALAGEPAGRAAGEPTGEPTDEPTGEALGKAEKTPPA